MKLVEVAPPDPPSKAIKERRPVSLLPAFAIGLALWSVIYWVAQHLF